MILTLIICALSLYEYSSSGYEVAVGSLIPAPKFVDRFAKSEYSIDCISFEVLPIKSNLILDQAIARFYTNTFHDRSLAPPANLSVVSRLVVNVKDLEIPLAIGVDESYDIGYNGSIAILKSNTTWGALRGLETFSQMIYQRILDDKYVIVPTHVYDFPTLLYRGIIVDVATGYFKVETIEKFIDSMSFLKYNVLGLQLTNDENFAFTSAKYPELHQRRNIYGNVFSRETLKHLIDYAQARGIIIEPQFRIPEGSSSWGSVNYIAVTCDAYVYEKFLYQINPILSKSIEVVSDVLIEAALLFKNTYLYFGVQPANYSCWKRDGEIDKYAKSKGYDKDYRALEVEFLTQVENKVKKYYKGVVYPATLVNDINPPPARSILYVKNYPESIQTIKDLIKKGYLIMFAGCFNLTLRKPWTHYERFINCPLLTSELTAEELKYLVGETSFIDVATEGNLFSKVWAGGFAVSDVMWNAERRLDHSDANQRYQEQDCRFFRRKMRSRNLSSSTYCRYDYTD